MITSDHLSVLIPSLQERRKVRVGSISFLILMSASSTIGPQLPRENNQNLNTGFDWQELVQTGNLWPLDFFYPLPLCGYHSLVEVDLIGLHAWLITSCIRIPAVDLKFLYPGLRSRGCSCLGPAHHLKETQKMNQWPWTGIRVNLQCIDFLWLTLRINKNNQKCNFLKLLLNVFFSAV